MMADGMIGGKKGRNEVLAFAIAIIVIMASVYVVLFYAPHSDSGKDNIIGDWYCATSEKYSMSGKYVTDEYSKGDDPLLSVYKCDGDMIYGEFDKMQFTGTKTVNNRISIVGILGGEYCMSIEGEYGDNGADEGIMYLTAVTFIESSRSTTYYASQYYVVVKDVSRIPIVGATDDLSFAIGSWAYSPNESTFMTEDGEDRTRDVSVNVSSVDGHLMKATVSTSIGDAEPIVDNAILSVMHWGDGADSYQGVMLYNKTAFCQIVLEGCDSGGYTMHIHLCSYADPTTTSNTLSSACYYFSKDGGTVEGNVYDFDLAGRTYRADSLKTMNKFGEVSVSQIELIISFVNTDRFNVCFTAICDNNVYLCKYAGYIHALSDGKYYGEYCIRDYNVEGKGIGSVGVACLGFNDDCTVITATAQQYIDGNWAVQTIEWHLIG